MPALLCAVLAGCGQTGYLYLQLPPTRLPPLQAGTPAPAALSIAAPYCVDLPRDEVNERNAAPAPGTSLRQVPYGANIVPPEPAPSSLTEILPACAAAPVIKQAHKPDKQP